MRSVLRATGNSLLWVAAVVGALSGALWVANAVGYLQPVIVVSGSMSPGIRTGDLLIAKSVDVAGVKVDDVTTLPSTLTGNLVTHRVIGVEQRGGVFVIRMQGDANDSPDAEEYLVAAGEKVWQPRITVPRGGSFVTTLSQRRVAVPLLISIAALIVVAAMPTASKPRVGEVDADDDGADGVRPDDGESDGAEPDDPEPVPVGEGVDDEYRESMT